MRLLFVLCLFLCAPPVHAATLSGEVNVEGDFLRLGLTAGEGGTVREFGLLATVGNFAGGEGILQEGFGVGSYYVPNRRLNERLEALENHADRPVLRYTYDCDGPNIRGLHVTRVMELLPHGASLRVTWSVENRGDETQWVAPWVRHDLTPGGSLTDADRLDVPTVDGMLNARSTAYHPAARNWFAATDPIEQESFCAIFDADNTHAFMTLWEPDDGICGAKTAFVPFALAPEETWKTVYRLNAVRGLRRVDFATDELACQIDQKDGTLTVLLSAAQPMAGVTLEARVLAANGRVWKLPPKRFSIAPDRLARCTYDWLPPGDGHYDFLGRLSMNGATVLLGRDTASPHGGIDARFTVGKTSQAPYAPWTDAPYALDRGPRRVKASYAARGDLDIWFASSLEKVFPLDQPEEDSPVDPKVRIALARNERESFQIVIRAQDRKMSPEMSVQIGALRQATGNARIPSNHITAYRVRYEEVRVPSDYEGPTGPCPDLLEPLKPFSPEAGQATPLWFTVHTDADTPPGVYTGLIDVRAAGQAPIELWLEVEVFDFTLPPTPAFKTDFGFWPEAAEARAPGLSKEQVFERYMKNALEHRVTLRPSTQLPPEQADYGAALRAWLPRFQERLAQGATTAAVPASLLDFPELLRLADEVIADKHLEDRVFVQLAHEPAEPSWPRLLEAMQQWKDAAPHIPIMVTSSGLNPFIPDALDRWTVHSQVFDTPHNKTLLKALSEGREVWWYVDHAPPRPYGNLLLDFQAIEHRILFWQAWALGVRGMYYWNVNYLPPGMDTATALLDLTPVNGDGILVYPGPEGPINSMRWEIIRDGIEDYDYLDLFIQRRNRLVDAGGHEALLRRAAEVYNLGRIVPDLVTFPRDPRLLLEKRKRIARMIEEMDSALP